MKATVSGNTLNLAYNASGLLAQVTDVLFRTATFAYDSSNRLTSIKTSGDSKSQTYSFTYDQQGRILTETTPEGVTVFTDTYDPRGRVVAQQDAIPDHLPACFYYDESQSNRLVTTVVDRTGATNIYVHNALYELLSVTDPLGHTTSYGYDINGDRIAITNALGNVQHFTYDFAGNQTSATDAAAYTTTSRYDSRNNLTNLVNAATNTATFLYDAKTIPTRAVDFLGNATTMANDANDNWPNPCRHAGP